MYRLSSIGKFDVHISLQGHLGGVLCLGMTTVVMVFTVLVRARQSICGQAVTSMGFFLTFVHTNAEIYLSLGLCVISAHFHALDTTTCSLRY